MAQKRGSERGVIRVASGMILAGFAALLSVTGCSSEQAPSEHVGTSVAALTCGLQVCNQDDCTTFQCKSLSCLLIDKQKDGTACTTATKEEGRCVTPVAGNNPICCTGCIVDNRGVLTCIEKPDAKNCGIGGADCAECTKGNTCNTPVCIVEKGVCDTQAVPNDSVACQDGGGAAGNCYDGVCCAGCIDSNGACQAGSAVANCGKPSGVKHSDCKACVDANKCDGTETCQAGVCTEQVGFVCPADGNVCHAPTCDVSLNCSQQLLTGKDCPDANKCNGIEKCNNGACTTPGTPKNCDDKNPCTLDDCDPKTGECINTPQAGSCDDGNLCNGIGICDASGACVINPSPSCDDGIVCTTDSCDTTPVTGGCKHVNNTVSCNDLDPCTTLDNCASGVCVGGPAAKCDDGIACTADTCKAGTGCQFTPLTGTTCNDGNDCSTGDHCEAGACKATGGKICDPLTNPCQKNKCDNTTGGNCLAVDDDAAKCRTDLCHDFSQCSGGVCPVGVVINCDDANPCTIDDCDPEVGCTNLPNDKATCTDADLCTETACKKGKCVAIEAPCDPFDDCHIAGTCNPKSGFCDSPPAPIGTDCDSGTGSCDAKAKCVPDPTNVGGAGGEGPTGTAGDGTGGTTTMTDGGEPAVGTGGAGNEPVGGDTGTEPTGGKAGSKATGGTDSTVEGGAPETPRHVFVRDPGGCSCSVPNSQPSSLAWLGGLALVGALARRRRARLDAVARNSRVS